MQVWSLDQENPLQEEKATHSTIAWRSPWTEESGGVQSIELQGVSHKWSNLAHTLPYPVLYRTVHSQGSDLKGVTLFHSYKTLQNRE